MARMPRAWAANPWGGTLTTSGARTAVRGQMRRSERSPEEPAHVVPVVDAHAVGLRGLDPLDQELPAPREAPARGAGQHEGPDPLGVPDGEDLREDPAHRHAHHVGALVPGGIEDTEVRRRP